MINELLFIGSAFFTILMTLFALYLGKEALIASVVMQGIIANIFLLKQVDMFGKVVTAADVFIIGLIFSLNLLQEYYGKASATRAVNSYIFALIWFLALRTIHLAYLPSLQDCTQSHFLALFSSLPRIIFATLSVSFITLHFERILFKLLLNFFGHKYLTMRNLFASSISQLIDTILFSYIALHGIVHSINNIIIFSFIIKMIAILLMSPFMQFAKYLAPTRLSS